MLASLGNIATPRLAAVATGDDVPAAINALLLLGEMATVPSIRALEDARTDPTVGARVAVRYRVVASLERTFIVVNTKAPAVDARTLENQISRLGRLHHSILQQFETKVPSYICCIARLAATCWALD